MKKKTKQNFYLIILVIPISSCLFLFVSLKSASSGELGTAIANTSSKSQYVKQEIRNFCNARSEKQSQQQQQQQQQQQADLPLPPPHSRQAAVSTQAQLTTQQQTHENDLNDLLQSEY